MSPWLLVPGTLAVGVGLALVVASALAGMKQCSDAAPTGHLVRLRHNGLRSHHRSAPRPGRHGQGLPADSEGGSQARFWAILTPFTPDDHLPGPTWPERGHTLAVPVELTARTPPGPTFRLPCVDTYAAFTEDDNGLPR